MKKARKLKVRLDRISGEVNLRIHFRDLSEVLTAASLHCFDSLEKRKNKKDRKAKEDDNYDRGLNAFCKAIDNLLEAQLRPYLYEDPLIQSRTVKERRETVEEARKERRLLDSVMEAILREGRERRAKSH